MEEDRPEPSNRREAAKEEGRETHRVAEVSADQGSDRMATGSGKDNRHADRFASMRVGEALALRWNDILGDRIIIDERLYDGDLDDPKTLHGSREVPFDEQGIIKAALTRIWNKTKHRGAGDFVFSTRNGTPTERRNVLCHLKAAAKAL